jgi:hypothetical protein
MAKIPDRKKWDSRTGSYMFYPGIKPVKVEVGRTYKIAWIDYDDYGEASQKTPYKVVGVKTFKTVGRRWTISSSVDVSSTSFLYEHEILEQSGRSLVVGTPWNYDKFNPNLTDRMDRKRERFLEAKARSLAADEYRYAKNDEFAAAGFVE